MEKRVYFEENCADLEIALEFIKVAIPCFINREYIEMNFSKVEIITRAEDIAFVERMMNAIEEV